MFENGPCDEWWPEVLQMLQHYCHMIHARVGYCAGPQVPDPAAQEYQNEVAAHFTYWTEVMKGQIERKRTCFVTPEHGAWPYQQSTPHTNMEPNHDIYAANAYIANLVTETFQEITK